MTDQPSTRPTPLDDRLLSAILDEDDRTFRVLSHAARYHEARMAHPAGRAGYVPLTSPPLPSYVRLGHALLAYAAVLLILAGFLVGVTVRPWVAIPLVWVGCLLGVRLAIVHHRTGEKS